MSRYFLILYFLSVCLGSVSATTRYKGDFNGDGKVDLADMVTLVSAINDNRTDNTFDLNVSGKIDDADLHMLADIIITRKLTEDTGFNAGIDGWDETGDDYGGTVGAPKRKTRASGTRFFVNNASFDFAEGHPYAEFGMDAASQPICGILYNIELPETFASHVTGVVKLYENQTNHVLYGTPVISGRILRFILFSPQLMTIGNSDSPLGRFNYEGRETYGCFRLFDCQVVSPGAAVSAVTIPAHSSESKDWNVVPVSSLSLDTASIKLPVGESRQLVVSLNPDNATNREVVWSSDNEKIATVSQNGLVTIVADGTTTIHVKTTDGSELEATCEVSGISVSSGIADIPSGNGAIDIYNLNGTVLMSNAGIDNVRELPRGCYIIRHNGKSYKFIK